MHLEKTDCSRTYEIMNVKNYQTSNLSKWSLRVADERSRYIAMLTEGLSANSNTFKDSFSPGLSTRRSGGFKQTRRVSTLAIHERELHAKRATTWSRNAAIALIPGMVARKGFECVSDTSKEIAVPSGNLDLDVGQESEPQDKYHLASKRL
jgi:hypothetical protein